MRHVAEDLITARDVYASSPSHADPFSRPEEGTFCMMTAVLIPKVMHAADALMLLNKVCDHNLIQYNAYHTTEECVAKFDEAIAESRKA